MKLKPFSLNSQSSGGDLAKAFEANLEKNSVKAWGPETYERINQILGLKPKSKFSTVNEIVQDLHKRTGLTQYLDSLKASAQEKTAALNEKQEILEEIFSKAPELKIFIDNFVETHPVTSILGLLENIPKSIKLKLNESEFNDHSLKKYINEKIMAKNNLEVSSCDPNIGKLDVSSLEVQDNDDLFANFTKPE